MLISILFVLAIFLTIYFRIVTKSFKALGEQKVIGLNIMNQTIAEIVKGLKEIKILGLAYFLQIRLNKEQILRQKQKRNYFFTPSYQDTL